MSTWDEIKDPIKAVVDAVDARHAGQVTALQARIAELEAAQPKPTRRRLLVGIYNGSGQGDEARLKTQIGRPNLPLNFSSTYYTSANSVPGGDDMRNVAAGRPVQVEIEMKIGGTGRWYTWADMADGKHDDLLRKWAEAFKRYGNNIIFTPDQEPEERLAKDAAYRGWKPEDYGRMFRHMRDVIHPIAPNVHWRYWTGVYHLANIERMYPGDEYVDSIGYDPYVWGHHSPDTTALQCFSRHHRWLDGRSWGKGKPRGLSETGYWKDFPQEKAAKFWAGVPDALEELNLGWMIIWNRGTFYWSDKPTYAKAVAECVEEIDRRNKEAVA